MNKSNIRRLAAVLLSGELATRTRGKKIGYNQSPLINTSGLFPDNSGHGCHTTACLAGHASILASGRIARSSQMWEIGRKWLGISQETAEELFSSSPRVGWDFIHPDNKQAALVLFNLAETGKVDWSLAQPTKAE